MLSEATQDRSGRGRLQHPIPELTSMNILITGAAGNLGSHLARHLADSDHHLRLMTYRTPLPGDLAGRPNTTECRADLARPDTLKSACEEIDCIIHFAGILFAPRPETFLERTNVDYVRNLLQAARENGGVRRFILVSFPHVEGESFPDRRAQESLEGRPASVHARTRLQAERLLFAQEGLPEPVALRSGMIYGRGVLMVEAARWLATKGLLAVWRQPTWTHLIALPDFLRACRAAIEKEAVRGVYNLGDDEPVTLQAFLDEASVRWGCPLPWRLPRWTFPLSGAACEVAAGLLGRASPLTRDFIRIGMTSYCGDTRRMKSELLPQLEYPSLREGGSLL